MSRGRLLLYLYRSHGRNWTIGLTIGLFILVAIGTFLADIRYLILAVMYIFILIPMIMSFLYFNYALLPDISFNALPHALKIVDSKIAIFATVTQASECSSSASEEEKDSNDNLNDKWSYGKSDKWDKKWDDKWNDKEENNRNDISQKSTFPEQSVELVEIRQIPISRIGNYIVASDYVIINLLPESRKINDNHGFIYLPTSAFPTPEGLRKFLETLYHRY